MRLLLAIAIAALASASANDAAQYSLGAWLTATANVPTIGVLELALRDQSADLHVPPSIASQPSRRICFEQIHAIEQQIVNGINFRFHVTGCALPASSEENDASEFGSIEPRQRSGRCVRACGEQQKKALQVVVFCQPWTQTTQVLSIVEEGATAYA